MSIDFKGCRYPKDVILYAVFFYVRYVASIWSRNTIQMGREILTYNRQNSAGKEMVDSATLADGQNLHQGKGKMDVSLLRSG